MEALLIFANEETFVDQDLLYVAGGLLVLIALVFSFMGMRNEDFPSPNQLKGIVGLTTVVVVATAFGAVQTARFEQAERRAENQEAAKEAAEQEQENEDSLDDSLSGEAADPESGTGATPDGPETETLGEDAGEPQSSTGGAPQVAAADLAAGQTLFTDTGCGSCHTLADADATGTIGPSLDEAVAEMDAEEVRISIVDPGAEVAEGFPDGTMPATYADELDDKQIDTLVNYLIAVTQG